MNKLKLGKLKLKDVSILKDEEMKGITGGFMNGQAQSTCYSNGPSSRDVCMGKCEGTRTHVYRAGGDFPIFYNVPWYCGPRTYAPNSSGQSVLVCECF